MTKLKTNGGTQICGKGIGKETEKRPIMAEIFFLNLGKTQLYTKVAFP